MDIRDSLNNIPKKVFRNPNNPLKKQDTSILDISKSLCKIEYDSPTAIEFLLKLFKEGKNFSA